MRIRLPAKEHIAPTSADDPAVYYYTRRLRYLYLKRLDMALGLVDGQHFGRLLEVGYGCGILFPELNQRCGELVAIDLHRKACSVRSMMEHEGIEGYLGVGDAVCLPFKGGAFDGVVCLSVLEFVEDISSALNEIWRVLKPGGTAVLGAPVLNWITGMAYERLIGHLRHREQHKSSHRRILQAVRDRFHDVRIASFPGFLSLDYDLFFCAACRKA
ncbi:MAG: class I SAM-dependent methyltransferase [Deltaproteobacteria bacterium]|nr:class I SAM-dependent methyltransferase [Deltaproteobacteria bacterium]